MLALIGSAAFSTTLITLSSQWRLSELAAGLIAGAYYLGYVMTVIGFSLWTDRIHPWLVYTQGCLLSAVSTAGFAFWAHGPLSAFLFQWLAGAGMAGIYMPGLRVVTRYVGADDQLGAVPYYTAGFGVGSSIDFAIAGWAVSAFGWRGPFVVGSLGSLAAIGLSSWAIQAGQMEQRHRPAPATKRSLGLHHGIAYAGHCWELFALRAWLPTFLTTTAIRHGEPFSWRTVALASTLINLAGVPASLAGAEAAARYGHKKVIGRVATLAVLAATPVAAMSVLGFKAAVLAALLYMLLIAGDSGALTVWAVKHSTIHAEGVILAAYSSLGFVGAAVGPAITGAVLTATGGYAAGNWVAGFAVMSLGSFLAAIVAVMQAEDGGTIGERVQPVQVNGARD